MVSEACSAQMGGSKCHDVCEQCGESLMYLGSLIQSDSLYSEVPCDSMNHPGPRYSPLYNFTLLFNLLIALEFGSCV